MERRIRPNHISAASAAITNGTSSAPQPRNAKSVSCHHESTAPSVVNSAMSESSAKATSAIAATSLRMLEPSIGTAPRAAFLAVRRAI